MQLAAATGMRYLAALLLVASACAPGTTSATPDGEAEPDGASTVDAPDVPPSDAPDLDAPTCAATGPQKASAVSIANLAVNKTLTLDGVGTRCEQLQRAILDPVQRPVALAKLDASTDLQPPLCTELAERTNVAITILGLGGQHLLSQGQYLHAWVDNDTDTLEEIRIGWFIEPPAVMPTTCASTGSTLAAVTGHQQVYTSFQLCAAYTKGTWTVADNDPRSYVGEGVYYDGTHLNVAREVDVEPFPANVTQVLRDSDLNCFGRIALILVVDPETGRVVDQRRHCIVC